LHVVADPGSPSGSSGLARFLALDPRICQFLLGGAALDARLAALARLEHPVTDPDGPPLVADLARLASRHGLPAIGPDPALVLALHGPDGVGKRELAGQVSASLGLAMLTVDARRLGDPDELVRAAVREARLQDAALCVTHADERAREDTSMLPALATALRDMGGLAFVTSSEPWHGLASFGDIPVHAVPLTEPDVPRSEVLWREELAGRVVDPEPWASELAQRFCLTPGAIRAASAAADRHRLTAVEPAPLTLRDIYAACREQSATRLADLAVVIHPDCGWEELVLPADRLEQLRDICTQVRHRHQVFDRWGLGARAGHGTGVTALFGGTPGTGKSMAAEVVAGDLGLDLYKVDLSGVVSKYIGETEKNLRRVFGEARSGNAVLFFDEADALFGKRTEVSDAHDRYANIETSYLLQQMELYDGVVLLATNIQQNLDEAFTRRIRFVVEFPFPDAASRARIWSTHLPATAPVAPDVDVDVLARDFPVAGGTIRNIVVNAAFLAAADGGVIDRHHILRGTRREYDKIGRLWTEP
jgi:AAA+ superfamily predicted ATPase